MRSVNGSWQIFSCSFMNLLIFYKENRRFCAKSIMNLHSKRSLINSRNYAMLLAVLCLSYGYKILSFSQVSFNDGKNQDVILASLNFPDTVFVKRGVDHYCVFNKQFSSTRYDNRCFLFKMLFALKLLYRNFYSLRGATTFPLVALIVASTSKTKTELFTIFPPALAYRAR